MSTSWMTTIRRTTDHFDGRTKERREGTSDERGVAALRFPDSCFMPLFVRASAEGRGTVNLAILNPELAIPVFLPPEAPLRGRVHDDLDLPVRAQVVAFEHVGFGATSFKIKVAEATTDAEGRYELRGLAAGTVYTLCVWSDSALVADFSQDLDPRQGTLDVELAPAASVQAVFVLPDAAIVAAGAAGFTELFASLRGTDEDEDAYLGYGEYGTMLGTSAVAPLQFGKLAAGRYTFSFGGGEVLAPVTIQVEVGRGERIVLPVATTLSRVVTGRILTPDGKPRSAAYLTARAVGGTACRTTWSTEDGTFRMWMFPEGEATLDVVDQDDKGVGQIVAHVVVAADATSTGDITLAPAIREP